MIEGQRDSRFFVLFCFVLFLPEILSIVNLPSLFQETLIGHQTPEFLSGFINNFHFINKIATSINRDMIYMQVRKQQLELDMEQQTGSK